MTEAGEAAASAVREAVEEALHVIGDDLEPQRLTALVRDIEDLAEVGEARHPWARR